MPDELSEEEQAALSDCYQAFRALVQVLEWQGRTIRMLAAASVAVMWEVVDKLPATPRTHLLNMMANQLNERITVIENEKREETPCGRIH